MSLLWTTAASRTLKSGPDGEAPKGMMIAVVPPVAVAKKLAMEDGETWDNIHCTLMYLPFEKNPDCDTDRLHKITHEISALYPPMHGKIGGVGTFNNPDNYVLWASANVPGLEIMRHALVSAIEAEGYNISKDHGFTPHVTLKYDKRPFRFMPKIEEHPFPVKEVWSCVGPQWKSHPLGTKKTASSDVEHRSTSEIGYLKSRDYAGKIGDLEFAPGGESDKRVNDIMATAKDSGIHEPLDVRTGHGDSYLNDGHHRYVAAKRLGIDVPVRYS